jgi:glyoxylase-like metal-dependent hydrolase (beta-lactamase superfamily II)
MTGNSHPARGAFVAALALTFSAFCNSAHAGATQIREQAPGFYRMMLGDFEITALSDGTVDLPVDTLLHQPGERTTSSLKETFLDVPTETSVNAFLVNTGSKLVLIDAGTGALFGPTLGNLPSNLAAAGYRPEQIDDIFITHIHPDHVGGLVIEGKAIFPNAVIHVEKAESDFWLSPETVGNSDMMKSFLQGARISLAPYVAAGKLQPFVGDSESVPGITPWASHGHTPGHSSYVVESKGQRLVVIGDLIHVGAVQLADPSVTIDYDVDDSNAAARRVEVFTQLAREGDWVGAAHLPFPGLGHLRSTEKSFRWVQANYTTRLK